MYEGRSYGLDYFHIINHTYFNSIRMDIFHYGFYLPRTYTGGTGCMARTPKVFCTVIAVMAVAA